MFTLKEQCLECALAHGDLCLASSYGVSNHSAALYLSLCDAFFVLSVFDHTFSANILLDDRFQAKLTDFAVAHFRPHPEQQSSTINMTGSGRKHLWYMPEEYVRQGRLSVKTDVYSFGIVSVACCSATEENSLSRGF